MKTKVLFYKAIPIVFVTVPLLTALVIFILKYGGPDVHIPLLVNIDTKSSRLLFYLNFFVPFFLCMAALYGCVFYSGFFIRGICLTAGLVSVTLSVYLLDDAFIVKICAYTAYVIMASLVFSRPKNIIPVFITILWFLLFSFHPSFMGLAPAGVDLINPTFIEIVPAVIFMIFMAVCMLIIRLLFDRYIYDKEAIAHLDSVGKKMLLFNHRLQEMVRRRSEEAVIRDRLRFTRDLHDSCGYAFTNIILVADAAVSRGKIDTTQSQEILHNIRKLASKGLSDTRETLHLIRKINEPYMKSIDAICQLKTIFEEVTGIEVSVEWGNMKPEYGPVINKVITKIIQEAFTNAVRHGKATRILIQFWEFPQELSMTVTDNGIGATVVIKGIGLAGMEERIESIGGKLDVLTPAEGGFRLIITIPLIGG
jgi:signal transduction histidine kinase